MATLNNAKTRIGVGGPSSNYTRPITAKAESEGGQDRLDVLFMSDLGKMMNP